MKTVYIVSHDKEFVMIIFFNTTKVGGKGEEKWERETYSERRRCVVAELIRFLLKSVE